MKKVFIITDFYHSQQNTTGYMLEKVYKALEQTNDFDVNLITRFEEGVPQLDNTVFVQTPKLDKRNLLKRFLYDSSVTVNFAQKIVQYVKKRDIVFTTTTPVFLILSIACLKKLVGFKWVLLVHDVFPENLVVADVIKSDSVIYKILTSMFNQVYRSADQLIVIGSDMKQLIEAKTHKQNISTVQNWIDTKDIAVQKKENNKLLTELGWHETSDVIFQFFGNLGRVQGLDKLLTAIKKIKNLDSAKFLFIGDGTYVSQLKDEIANINHPNVVYYGKLPPNQKSDGLNACDIAFVTLAEGMKGLGVPSKAYYSMAANKYLFAIMDNDTEIVDMVKDKGLGWYCTPSDTDKIALKIDEVIELWNNPTKQPVDLREILEQNYSERVAMTKIIDIIKKC